MCVCCCSCFACCAVVAYPEEVVLLLRVELPRVHLDLLLMEVGRVLHEALRNNKKKAEKRERVLC